MHLITNLVEKKIESRIEKALEDSSIALKIRETVEPKKHASPKKIAAITAVLKYINSKENFTYSQEKLSKWRYEGLKNYMAQRQIHNIPRQKGYPLLKYHP